MPRQLVFTLKQNKRKWRGNCCEVPQYVCNYVDPSSDTFVSELRITSPGKDILRDLVGQERVLFLILLQSVRHGTSLKSVRADMKPVAHATCAQKFAVMITVALPTHIHTHTPWHTHTLSLTHMAIEHRMRRKAAQEHTNTHTHTHTINTIFFCMFFISFSVFFYLFLMFIFILLVSTSTSIACFIWQSIAF